MSKLQAFVGRTYVEEARIDTSEDLERIAVAPCENLPRPHVDVVTRHREDGRCDEPLQKARREALAAAHQALYSRR